MKGEEHMTRSATSILKTFRSSTMVVLAAMLFIASICSGQSMQKGISVDLPITRNGMPMPDADKENSLIVTVTEDGSVYFGTGRISPASLPDRIKTERKLYVKADARTPYATVANVLQAVRSATPEVRLLTAQPESAQPGGPVAPVGLEVQLSPSASGTTALQVFNSPQGRLIVKINNEEVPSGMLRGTLSQLLQTRTDKSVQVTGDARLSFADIVRVTDTCSSAGARVVLITAPM
jgi:biopolymer transport protein TolR